MNKAFAFILIQSLFLIACNSEKSNPHATSEEIGLSPSETGMKSQASLLNGEWISKDFLDEVRSQKSMIGLHPAITPIGLSFNSDELQSDTGYVYGFDTHEGGYRAPIKFSLDRSMFIYENTRSDEYDCWDQPFEIEFRNYDQLTLRFTASGKEFMFTRTADYHTDIRKALIAGKYKNLDASNNVHFNSDGTMHGIGENTYYEIHDDIASDENPMNIIFLRKQKVEEGCEGACEFKFSGDTLRLYMLGDGEMAHGYKSGDLRCTLLKVRNGK